jgi:hypothetical protein
MTEYGIFSDEGLLEGQFYDLWKAEERLLGYYHPDDGAYVAVICPDHPEQEELGCEECNEYLTQ